MAVRASDQFWHRIWVSDVQVPQTHMLWARNHVQVAMFGIEITCQAFSFFRWAYFITCVHKSSYSGSCLRSVLALNLSFRCSVASDTHFTTPQPCASWLVWDWNHLSSFSFYWGVHFFQMRVHTILPKFKIRAVLASNLSFRCPSASDAHVMGPQPCASCNQVGRGSPSIWNLEYQFLIG